MRVLIIEDDRKVAGFLARGLKEEQYAVDVCRDGEEALQLAQLYDYDIIILDIMLPRKDGFTVCRELRAKGIFTPILMLTAKDALEDKVKGLSEGADDYLTKPFSFEELLARIKALFRRSQDYKTTLLKAEDLVLDPLRRTVKRGNQKIELTGKEFALLEYLLRNKGRIISPTMILEHVWDKDYLGGSNVVNVYINHLREKIDRPFAKKLIKTIRGQGFTIDEN
ncbi:MAG: DNA-binding response regulator [Candidatus Aminicenantes bacterium]|nr:MAG: DNA-binding response regulator [Candidatus Aminicenantes bacterium]HHF43554.1 response regulator transcription factor [Candidatus Aminicenantes bacterium]